MKLIQNFALSFVISSFLFSCVFKANAQILPVDMFDSPFLMNVSDKNGLMFVLSQGNRELDVLDLKTRSLLNSIRFGSGFSDIASDPENSRLYISFIGSNEIAIIDEKESAKKGYAPKIIKESAGEISQLTVDLKNKRLLAFSPKTGSISAINRQTEKVEAVWPISGETDSSLDLSGSKMILSEKRDKIYIFGARGNKPGLRILNIITGKPEQELMRDISFHSGVLDDSKNRLYLFSTSPSKALSVFDTGSGKILKTFPLDLVAPPRTIAYSSSDGKIFLSDFDGGLVLSLDAVTLDILSRTDLGKGSYPGDLYVDEIKGKIYAPETGTNKISVIDIKTGVALQEFDSGGRNPVFSAASASLNEIYFLNPESNNILIIDAKTDSSSTIIPSQAKIGGEIFSWPNLVVFDGTKAYVLNNLNGTVVLIDCASDKIRKIVQVGQNPRNIAIGGDKVYVTVADEDRVAVLSRKDLSPVAQISVKDKPDWIYYSSRNDKVYITYRNDSAITVIDPKTDVVIKNIEGKDFRGTIEISADTNRLYVGSKDNTKIFAVDLNKNEVVEEIAADFLAVGALSVSQGSDGRQLMYYDYRKNEFVFLNENGYRVAASVPYPKDSYAYPKKINDKALLFIPQPGGVVEIFDRVSGKSVENIIVSPSFSYRNSGIWAGKLASGEVRVVISDYENGRVYLYDYDHGKFLAKNMPIGRAALTRVNAEAEKIYAVSSLDDRIDIYDLREGKFLTSLDNKSKIYDQSQVSEVFGIIYFWDKLSDRIRVVIALLMLFLLSVIIIILRRRNNNQPPNNVIT